MSVLNFGLKISTFKINININIDEKSDDLALANLLKKENMLQQANSSKEKAFVDFHYSGCRY